MSDAAVEVDGRYWAFISYSHKDAAFGRRLHRRLEGYALPRRIVGQAAASGAVPRRLAPIFRDRDEFPAAKDLSAEVQAALKVSRSLIVVCSPTAAQSPWVAREIELFHALHPDRPILAAIREGEPHDAFPEGLRHAGPGGADVEPLAADFRRGHDGWDLGLLKLVAGVLGVGLDELIRRDAQRRARRVTAVTAGALALVLVMAVLTLFALNARSEAERQRAEAEGLVEFMLTDLRTTLKGVGRLDAMTAVNERALRFFDSQINQLSPSSLIQRAAVLQAMGDDDETRGNSAAALTKFQEAWRTTSTLLNEAPNEPARVFAHAQSEYWLGKLNYDHDRFAEALQHFRKYKLLADRLFSLSPRDPRSMHEAAYAEGDLCSIALTPPKNGPLALKLCTSALRHMETATRPQGSSFENAMDLANRHGWLADAYLAVGDYAGAISERQTQDRILQGLIDADPHNEDLKSFWIALQRIMAWMDAKAGHVNEALDRTKRATAVVENLIELDPTNQTWLNQRKKLTADLTKLLAKQSGRTAP